MIAYEIVHQFSLGFKGCIVSISRSIEGEAVCDETISISTLDSKINPFFRAKMEHLFKGILGYHSDDNLHKPIGYSTTSTIHHHAYKIQTHKYRIKLCSDKNSCENWPNINLKAIGQLLALERSFCHFLAFNFYASHGTPPYHFPIKPQDFFKIKMYTGAAGLRHYTDVLQQNIVWLLGAENWFKDQKSLTVFHNFMVAVIKLNYGGQHVKSISENDFSSTILTRSDGDFEVTQLNILKNIVAKTATPILRNIPVMASFYQAFDFDIQQQAVFVNVEVVSTLKFPGMSTFVHNMYCGRGMNLHRLFSTEMLEKMNCPTHAQDSQKANNSLSIENSAPIEPLMNFDPPSPNKVSSSNDPDRLNAIEITPNPKPSHKRNVAQNEIKSNLNWNDVFGPSSSKTSKPQSVAKVLPLSDTNDIDKGPQTKPKLSKCEADVLPGENSDDFFDSSMEYDDSTVVVGKNKNDSDPVIPIPTVLSTEEDTGAPEGPSTFDMLSTSSDSQSKTHNSQKSNKSEGNVNLEF